jgi:hypothetical protein
MVCTYTFDGVVIETRLDQSGSKVLFVILDNPEAKEKQRVRINVKRDAFVSGSGSRVRGAGSVVFGSDPHVVADCLKFGD